MFMLFTVQNSVFFSLWWLQNILSPPPSSYRSVFTGQSTGHGAVFTSRCSDTLKFWFQSCSHDGDSASLGKPSTVFLCTLLVCVCVSLLIWSTGCNMWPQTVKRSCDNKLFCFDVLLPHRLTFPSSKRLVSTPFPSATTRTAESPLSLSLLSSHNDQRINLAIFWVH